MLATKPTAIQRGRGIRSRLLILLLALISVPLVLNGLATAYVVYRNQQQQSVDLEVSVVDRIRVEVASYFNERTSEIGVLLRNLSWSTPEERRALLSNLPSYPSSVQELTLLDAQGQIEYRISELSETQSSTDWGDVFAKPLASGKPWYGPFQVDAVTGEPFVLVGFPYLSIKTGEIKGVLIANIRSKAIWTLLAGLTFSDERTVYIMDAAGRIIADRDPSVVLRGASGRLPGGNGIQPGLGGTPALLASVPLDLANTRLYIVSERSLAAAFALFGQTLLLTLIAFGVLLLFSIGIASIVGQRFVRPITDLAYASSLPNVRAEQIPVPARQDELTLLAQTIRALVASNEQRLNNYGALYRITGDISGLLNEDRIVETVQARLPGLFGVQFARLEQGSGPLSSTVPAAQATQTFEIANYGTLTVNALDPDNGEAVRLLTTYVQTALYNARLYAEAESAGRAKSQFLATMSHELRTPLNSIINYPDLISLEDQRAVKNGASVGVLTDRQRLNVSKIYNNSLRLLGLINDILDISRIEAQRMELADVSYSPRQVLDHLYETAAGLQGVLNKSVTLHLDVEESVPQRLQGDPERVEQILLNLVGNAVKFTPAGAVTIHARADAGGLRVAVSDTGIGIPAHMLTVIFESFRQVDQSSTRAYGGSGLGLSIVKQLVNLMGGSISVESTLGKGSRFEVLLPIKDGVLSLNEQYQEHSDR